MATKQQIIDEARATVERVKDVEPTTAPPVDPGMAWRARATERIAEREAAQAQIAQAQHASWDAIDARIAQALERERMFILEVIGEAIGEMFAKRDKADRTAELTKEITDLWRAVGEAQKAVANVLRETIANDKTIDMPSPLQRRERVN